MKKFILILLSVCLLSACSVKEKTEMTLYFPDRQSHTIAEETRTAKETGDLLEMTIRALLSGPGKANLYRAIPEGTSLLGIKTLGTVAEINLSSPFDTGKDADRLLARYTVIYTACTVPGVQKVKLLKDGAPLRSLSSGEVLGALGMADVSLSDPEGTAPQLLTLYFTDAAGAYLYPETRQVSLKESETPEEAILDALLRGPDQSQLYPAVHEDSALISVETRLGIAFVNFGKDFVKRNTGDRKKESIALYSIVNSLCSLPHIQEVRFLIEGQTEGAFGHFDFMRGFTENKSLYAPH